MWYSIVVFNNDKERLDMKLFVIVNDNGAMYSKLDGQGNYRHPIWVSINTGFSHNVRIYTKLENASHDREIIEQSIAGEYPIKIVELEVKQ